MDTTKTSDFRSLRRSERIPLAVPLLVSSLVASSKFAERCETTSVSRHGCLLRSPVPLELDVRVRLDIPHTDRTTTARVVSCNPTEPGSQVFEIALELDKAQNFWGIRFPPDDWREQRTEEAPAAAMEKTEVPSPPPAKPVPSESSTAVAPPATQVPSPPLSAPPAPRAEAPSPPPSGPAPTPAPRVVPLDQIEPLLREKAKAISAEFENSYRQSLGDLLVRLRADLEQKAEADWERYRNQAQQTLQELTLQVRQQVDEELNRRREDSGEVEAKLKAVEDLRTEVMARLQTAGEIFQQQVGQERDQLLSQTREELEALAAEVRSQIQQALQPRADQAADLSTQLEEVHSTRDYVESLIRTLPQTVNQRVDEGVAAALERIRTRLEEDSRAVRESQAEQLEKHLIDLSHRTQGDLRQKLFEDFERQERESFDRIHVRLEEAKALEAQRQDMLKNDLERRGRELNERAENAVRNLGEQAWGSLKERLQTSFDQRQQELQQALETAQAETSRLETRAEKLAARLDADLESRLEQALVDSLGRARDEFQQVAEIVAESVRQSVIDSLDEKVEKSVSPLVSRAEATASHLQKLLASVKDDRAHLESQLTEFQREAGQARAGLAEEARECHERLNKTVDEVIEPARGQFKETAEAMRQEMLNSVQRELARLEDQAGAFRRDAEQAQSWLARETQQFQTNVHDALVEASGQIKGRVHQAVEMVDEPVERRTEEARAQLEDMATRKTQELHQQLEEMHQRLTARRTEFESSLEERLQARVSDVLGRFERETEKLARDASGQLQATLNEALESVSRTLRDKLGGLS